MKKCHITNKDIEQYLFDRLDEDEEIAFQHHLFSCEECTAKVQHLRRLTKSFHPETIVREEAENKHDLARVVPFVRTIRPWLVAASIVLVFAVGWIAGRYNVYNDQQLADNAVQTQIENPPEYASNGSVAEKVKKEFTFLSPGEGRYLFNVNDTFSDENNMIFKWSPKASNALLIIKSDNGFWDEIKVENTDYIKVNMTKYSSYRYLTWFLIVSESEEVMKGGIDMRKYTPPYKTDVQDILEK